MPLIDTTRSSVHHYSVGSGAGGKGLKPAVLAAGWE